MPTFYSTFVPSDEDNTSLRSIVGSFKIQVLPSNIAQITNTSNEGILCRVRERWWEEFRVIEEQVAIVLTKKCNIEVREIKSSHLLTSVRVVYSIIQYTMLLRSGNTDVMSEVDQMVMFCLMIRRRINLARLILDYILLMVNTERRSYATLPYSMFLTKVFIRA